MEVVQCYIFNGFSSRLSILSFSDKHSSCSIACKFLKSAANGLEAVKCETVLYQQHDMPQGTCAFIQSGLQCTTTLKCVNLTETSRFILLGATIRTDGRYTRYKARSSPWREYVPPAEAVPIRSLVTGQLASGRLWTRDLLRYSHLQKKSHIISLNLKLVHCGFLKLSLTYLITITN